MPHYLNRAFFTAFFVFSENLKCQVVCYGKGRLMVSGMFQAMLFNQVHDVWLESSSTNTMKKARFVGPLFKLPLSKPNREGVLYYDR